jgi:hypothetical protein
VELSLQERRRGRKNFFLKGKEGRVGFRKKPFLMVKKDGMILEKYLLKETKR